MGVQVHQLHFVVEIVPVRIIESEIKDADDINSFQLIIPFSPLGLFTDRESSIIHTAVFKELLLTTLHFQRFNKL